MVKHVINMIQLLQQYVLDKEDHLKEEIIRLEEQVDLFEKQIEEEVFDLFSLQQPQFNNLVFLLWITRVIRDLERVGDQVINFITMYNMSTTHPLFIKKNVNMMLNIALEMLTDIWIGTQVKEKGTIQKAIDMDDLIDKLHLLMYADVVEQMKTAHLSIDLGSQMIIMLRFVERLGDHIVNIGEAYQDYLRLCQ